MKEKILKPIKINGQKVKIELSKEEAKSFPKKLESSMRIKNKDADPISKCIIFA